MTSKVVILSSQTKKTPPPEQFRSGERAPYINLREGIFPMAGLTAQQQERLWRLWDLTEHLKRACVNATLEESHTQALETALHQLLTQLHYKAPGNETDPN